MSDVQKLTDKPIVSSLTDEDYVFSAAGNAVRRISVDNFRKMLNLNDSQVLNDFAFSLDINNAGSKGTYYVDVGGNLNMRAMWENSSYDILMDKNGNYCKLNRKDARYTEDGEIIVNTTTGLLLDKWKNCDIMGVIPKTYGKIQTVVVGSVTKQLLWLSLVPLPNGFEIPQQVVGKFKCYKDSAGALRSVPGYVPTASNSLYGFWGLAQARSKNHGIANLDFRNLLLWHMMSKYGYRDCQNCKGTDGTPVWGVGLDGSENTSGSSNNGFARQNQIKTGASLSLGRTDGKVAVTDSAGGTAHSVNCFGFENPWGQYWEMVGGLCSVGTKVFFWRGNFIPSTASNPTEATFTNVDHVVLQRKTSEEWISHKMNIIASEDGQGCYMIPTNEAASVSYGDYYYYGSSGQLWLFGGASVIGSYGGLAYAYSDYGWSSAPSSVSARLAYFGDIKQVSTSELARLAA